MVCNTVFHKHSLFIRMILAPVLFTFSKIGTSRISKDIFLLLLQDGSSQAQSNLKFLSILKEPCETLAAADPAKIPSLFPNLLSLIRIIWVNSEHYCSRERITGLLRKVCSGRATYAKLPASCVMKCFV